MLDEYFVIKLCLADDDDATGAQTGNGDVFPDGDVEQTMAAALGPGKIRIASLPLLLEGHSPVPEGLPMFLLRLATEVRTASHWELHQYMRVY